MAHQLLGSSGPQTHIRGSSNTRQCAAARPSARSVRGVVQAPSHQAVPANFAESIQLGRISIQTRAVRADQQTEVADSALLQTIAQITATVDSAVDTTLAASAEAAKSLNLSSDSELRQKVVRGVEKLQKGLLERETEVRVLLPCTGVPALEESCR